jgi:hypothetical protein
LVPLTVCEILRDLSASQGKTVAVLGRYSFRESAGSWVGEQACEPPVASTPQLLLVEDPKDGPKPPESFELDAPALRRKLSEMGRHTSLGKFRFGSPDYDRWAVVYGRLEPHRADDKRTDDKRPAANLVFRGDGVVIFVKMDQ